MPRSNRRGWWHVVPDTSPTVSRWPEWCHPRRRNASDRRDSPTVLSAKAASTYWRTRRSPPFKDETDARRSTGAKPEVAVSSSPLSEPRHSACRCATDGRNHRRWPVHEGVGEFRMIAAQDGTMHTPEDGKGIPAFAGELHDCTVSMGSSYVWVMMMGSGSMLLGATSDNATYR